MGLLNRSTPETSFNKNITVPITFSTPKALPKTPPVLSGPTTLRQGTKTPQENLIDLLTSKIPKGMARDVTRGLLEAPGKLLFGDPVARDAQRELGVSNGDTIINEGLLPFAGRTDAEKMEKRAEPLIRQGVDRNRAYEIAGLDVQKSSVSPYLKDIKGASSAREKYNNLGVTEQEEKALRLPRLGQSLGTAFDIAGVLPVGSLSKRAAQQLAKEAEGRIGKQSIEQLENKGLLSRAGKSEKTEQVSLLEEAKKYKSAAEKQIEDYKKEGIFLTEKDNPTLGMVPAEKFNGKDIVGGQLTVDNKGVEKWKKRIQDGERPSIVLDTSVFDPKQIKVTDGHHRLEAYLDLGFKEIPVIDNTKGIATDLYNQAKGGSEDLDGLKAMKEALENTGFKRLQKFEGKTGEFKGELNLNNGQGKFGREGDTILREIFNDIDNKYTSEELAEKYYGLRDNYRNVVEQINKLEKTTPKSGLLNKVTSVRTGKIQDRAPKVSQTPNQIQDRTPAVQKGEKQSTGIAYAETLTRPINNAIDAKSTEQLFSVIDEAPPTSSPAVQEVASGDVSNLKDISGFKGQAQDIYRNFKQVFGGEYESVKKKILDPFDASKGRYVDEQEKLLSDLDENVVSKLGISKGSKESAAVMDFGEKLVTKDELIKKFGTKKAQDIENAAKWFRSEYDRLIDEINVVRAQIYPNRQDKLIPKRENYFRHFQDMNETFAGLKNIFDTPSAIDPSLVGVSPFVKPKSKFLSFAQKRLGLDSSRDAVGGFLDYAKAFSYAKHIDPHIGDFRSLAKELAEKTADTKNLNNFIEFLQDYANDLAGKTNPADRYIQKIIPFGRQAFRAITWTNSRVKANTIVGNLSSSIAQAFNIPQGIGSAKQHSIYGAVRTLGQIFDKGTPITKSNFIKERYSNSMYDKFDTGMLKYPKRFASWITGVLDEVGTKFIWNSHYEKALREGIPNPIKYADDKARALVAGRGVGEVPLVQKSKVFQIVAPFQLEVGNLIWALRDMAKEKDIAGLATFAVASYLMNRVAEDIRGNDVSFDPVEALYEAYKIVQSEGEKKYIRASGRLAGEVLSNVPLGQTVASLYPEYGMTINDYKLPTRASLFGKGDPTRFGGGLLSTKGLQDPLFKVLPPFGGAQLKKLYEGGKVLADGGSFDKGNNLQFESPKDLLGKVKMLSLGKYSSAEGKEYVNRDEVKAEQKDLMRPIYDEVKKLEAEGREDEAQAIVDELSEPQYEVYKKISADEKRKATIEGKKLILPVYQKVKQLDAQGRGDEAQAIVDSLTEDEYRYYTLIKEQLEN